MMRTTAIFLIFITLGMMSRVCYSMYKKGDFVPLFGSPLSDQAPKYCAEEDKDNDPQIAHQSKVLLNCTKAYKALLKSLQESLSGTTASMGHNNSHLLAGLLNVGGAPKMVSSAKNHTPLAYVPPLDGVRYSMWEDSPDLYAMTFVPFDIKLVSLKNVDSLGSSFTAQWQILMQWESLDVPLSRVRFLREQPCKFWCDTTKPNSLCCDNMWVPPLHIPNCNIDSIESKVDSIPPVYIGLSKFPKSLSYNYQACQKKRGRCYKKMLWILNIQTTCDTQMNFRNFPFDTQKITMDLSNPYSSRTWFQLVTDTLRNNGGNIVNGVPSLDDNVPSWHITKVAVSRKCSLPTWRQTFFIQNSLLMQWNTSSYDSQEQIIEEYLNSSTCAKNYTNLNVPHNVNLADPSDHALYDIMLDDYKARFENTLNTYKSCVISKGVDYKISRTHISQEDGQLEELIGLEKLFGSWLNITDPSTSQKVHFGCLIDATASLTTPIITVSIMLKRYKTFYLVKLYVPAILCGVFTFAVAAISPSPHNLVNRLTIIVSSTLALTALQIAITATDIPPVSYIVPTSYLVLATYTMQVLVALETIVVAKWNKAKEESIESKLNQENTQNGLRRKKVILCNKENNGMMTKKKIIEVGEAAIEGHSDTSDEITTLRIREKASEEVRETHSNDQSLAIIGRLKPHANPFISIWLTNCLRFKKKLLGCSNRQLDFALLFVLAASYIIILFLCLFVPYVSGENEALKSNGFTIWPEKP